ncbi:MAG: trigger factor [Flavobacteriales bacterium]|nr:trigger factor [Flavobacteriales bacterium]
MDIKQEKIDDLNALLRVKIGPEDYSEKVDETLKNYRKQANIPGFRQGKVPMGLIKKKYGPSVVAEEVNKAVNNALYEHITDQKIDILGNPMPKEDENNNIDWANPSDMEFTYEIGLAPAFEVKLTKKDKVTYHKVIVDDKVIDTQIEDFAKRYGKLVPADKSEAKDMLLGAFKELDGKGKEKEGGILHTSTISIEMLENEKIKKKLTGLKVGDSLILDPQDVSKGDADKAAMLGLVKDDLEGLSNEFEYTISEIKRMQPATVNSQLFDKIYGEGNVTTEEEFRNKIKDEMSSMFNKDSDRVFKRDLSEALIKKLKLSLPDEFLKRWIKATNENEISQEQIEEEYEQYSKSLRWQLIENKIIADNELKVEQEEVVAYTKGLLVQQYAQYGMPAPEEDALAESAVKVLQDQDEAKKVYEAIYERKIVDFAKENIKIDEKELSYEDFVKVATA